VGETRAGGALVCRRVAASAKISARHLTAKLHILQHTATYSCQYHIPYSSVCLLLWEEYRLSVFKIRALTEI
jgi:hypothetical protein